ncbi:MAG TPA: ATP-binding cassette domain-containing protein [Gammaproteobacteria bacterium]|nr:ATP-binding cassette domain-containing protein [Gammaproteobacteria bacterium]
MVLMIIKTRNLTKKVSSEEGELIILNDINLELEKGKSLAVVGPSGSGKSTLLGLLAGLDSPTSGEVFLNNRPLHELNEDQRAKVRKENVAFVFQSFELLPGLTALENVMLPSELNRDKDAETRASEYLTRVGLGKRLKHYPRQLSGGEQQRVAIARAFACKAKVLFVDEPTGNLDNKTGTKISELLFEVNEESSNALVVVTHDTNLASKCDNQIELSEGSIA